MRRVLGHGTLIALSLVFVLPFAWMLTTSFQPDTEYSHNPSAFLPASPSQVDAINGKYMQVYVISLREPITQASVERIKAEGGKCAKTGATLLVLDLDIAEGDVDAAIAIAHTLKYDLGNINKVCFIRHRAVGVGAIVALACNSTVMTPASRLGQCEPLLQLPKVGKFTKPEDVRAALQNELLESARLNGYSAALTMAMIAPDSECWLIARKHPDKFRRELKYALSKDSASGVTPLSAPGAADPAKNAAADWEQVSVVHDGKGLLTLTPDRAAEVAFSKGTVAEAELAKMLDDLAGIAGKQTELADPAVKRTADLLRPLDKRAPIIMGGEMSPPDISRQTPQGWFLLAAAPPPFEKELRHWSYTPTLDNYKVGNRRAPIPLYFRNSLIVCSLTVLGTILSCSLVAYGFSILRWKGRNTIFFIMLMTMMLPGHVTMVPVFRVWTWLNCLDTFVPLVLPAFLGAPFFIFLFRQFFLTIPRDLVDAARMDGSSELGIYARICMPLSVPAIATVALFSFLGSWNDFLGPLLYLHSRENYTLSIGLAMLRDQNQGMYGQLMGVAALMIIPVIVLFFFAQKTFIQGIKTSGIKG